MSAKLPVGVNGSGHFIIAVIDADNTVAECNEDNNIIVFGYPHGPDIDLWFHPQGCSFLDNGFVFGGEPANLSYGSFYELVTSLTR